MATNTRPQRALPAKVAPPRLPAVHLRTRLFAELDRARAHSVIWIAAPAGFGKTTLVASYLRERAVPTLWYQLDEGDGDVAAYFHYLALAAEQVVPERQWAFPDFTPEDSATLPVFARRTFEHLTTGLPSHAVMVLDNYQQLPVDTPLHQIFHGGFSQIPAGMNVIVISRFEPPSDFVTDRANGVVVTIGQPQLRLTEAEALAIGRNRWPLMDEPASNRLRDMHQRVEGWPAGLALMLEQWNGSEIFAPAPINLPHQALFDYFFREVFEKSDVATQRLLLCTAYLPTVSATAAAALTGDEGASEILRRLHRNNLFTVLKAETPSLYQYHPLLSDFLREQVTRALNPADRAELTRRSAELLEKEGFVEDAAQLMLGTGAFKSLAALVMKHGPELRERGRHQTLGTWLAKMPSEMRAADPWLLFWEGICRLPFDAGEAHELITRAYEGFRAKSDSAGSFVAWASAVRCVLFESDDLAQLDFWIAELAQLSRLFPAFPSPAIEARVVSGMFVALAFRQPAHPEMQQWCLRAQQLVACMPSGNDRVLLGTPLFLYQLTWLGELPASEKTLSLMRPAIADKLSDSAAVLWQYCIATWYYKNDCRDEALVAIEAAERLIDEQGSTLWQFKTTALHADILLSRGDLAGATLVVAQLERLVVPGRRIDHAQFQACRAWMASLRGEAAAALSALDIMSTLVGPNVDQANAYIELAGAQASQAAGVPARAEQHGARALGLAKQLASPLIEFESLILLTWIRIESKRVSDALASLAPALRLGRERGYARLILRRSDNRILAQVCGLALEAGVEAEFACRMIRERQLVPPPAFPVPEAWPLPVKIYTLGRFSLVRDGKSTKFIGKAKNKPLELLKALIALGGRDVREDRLAEALWPDVDADAAAYSLTSTVHRLRALVGADAIQRQSGRLSLDAAHCWVDLWSFERQLSALDHAHHTEDLLELERRTTALVHQYRGEFLENDKEHPWVLGTRERLQTRFLRLLYAIGNTHARARRYEQASVCFKKAADIAPFDESAYQGLMRLNLDRGRHSDVLSTYERCRRMLAAGLGCAPSDETQALVGKARIV